MHTGSAFLTKDFIGQIHKCRNDTLIDPEFRSWMHMISSIYAFTHDGIMVTDTEGLIVDVNPAFCDITGYRREEVIGKSPRILSSGKHSRAYYEAMWGAVRQQGRWSGEIINKRKSGELLSELLTISAIAGHDGGASHYVGIFCDISEVKRARAELDYRTNFDSLTGLPNRILLQDRLLQSMATARLRGSLLAVCHLELPDFLLSHFDVGYQAGDVILQTVTGRIQGQLRPGDTIARIGDDDFVLLLANLESIDDLESRLASLLRQIAQPVEVRDERGAISLVANVGVTLFPHDGDTSEVLLGNAGQALLHARGEGAGRWHLYDKRQQVYLVAHRQTVNLLRDALAAGEFKLYFQPKIDLFSGALRGVEALIRWPAPDGRVRTPRDFLPLLHSAELAPALDEWVIRTALGQLEHWSKIGLEVPISVNVSAGMLAKADVDVWLSTLMKDFPAARPERLELEIVESAAIEDLSRTASNIAACRRIGVTSSLDDFGTGHSSLTYLRTLPVQTIKIDQSFVANMLEDPASHAIVRGVLGMAGALDRDVVAEGAATNRHLAELRKLGCRIAQGYAIAEPLSAVALEQWVKRHPQAGLQATQ